ncbi:ribonuclease HI [Streptomyces sp. T-3]|nr:ribonuclease HI [Streptomyces sp. T-3]
MSDLITAACDGASKGNPGRAAWAWVIADGLEQPQRWEAGPLGTATNNVAELTALARLLEATDPLVALEVRMDSQYAINAVTKWLPGWRRNGWRTSAGKDVANRDLVAHIAGLLKGREVDFRYVPAHQVDGDPLNAIADQAASDAAVAQEPAGTAHGSADFPVPRPAPADAPRRAAKKPKRAATGTIRAKFAGRCRCGTPYAAGEQIAKNPDGWGHPDCRADATA